MKKQSRTSIAMRYFSNFLSLWFSPVVVPFPTVLVGPIVFPEIVTFPEVLPETDEFVVPELPLELVMVARLADPVLVLVDEDNDDKDDDKDD